MASFKALGSAELLAEVFGQLSQTIDDRAEKADIVHSYTARLLRDGPLKCAKKMMEESAEFGLAMVAEDDGDVADEAADLLYHWAVCLRARGIALETVARTLAERQHMSGLEEKATRLTER